jgi:4-hydroxy-tetrahydrodipicolinate synthase
MPLSQVITMIPTFFNNDHSINLEFMSKHIDHQLKNGINDFVILGSLGESSTLTIDEKRMIAEYIYNKFSDNNTNIIIGLTGEDTYNMLDEINILSQFADYIMISQPFYNNPTQEGIYQHYRTLIESTIKPIIINNLSLRKKINIHPETIQQIATINNRVVAIKEDSKKMEHIILIKIMCPDLLFFTGNDLLILPTLSIGGYGVISEASNIIPNQINSIVRNAILNISTSYKIFYNILPIIKGCYIENSIVAVKYIISNLYENYQITHVRLPLVLLSSESKTKISTILNNTLHEIRLWNF